MSEDGFVPADPGRGGGRTRSVEELQAFADILAARLQKLRASATSSTSSTRAAPSSIFLRTKPDAVPAAVEARCGGGEVQRQGIETQMAENIRQLTGPASPLARDCSKPTAADRAAPVRGVLRNRGPIRFDLSAATTRRKTAGRCSSSSSRSSRTRT
jgi:hypothetical protein